MNKTLRLSPKDNVVTCLRAAAKGDAVETVFFNLPLTPI